MKILSSIAFAHKERDKPLPIKITATYAMWTDETSAAWKQYRDTLDEIYRFNRALYRFLIWIGYI